MLCAAVGVAFRFGLAASEANRFAVDEDAKAWLSAVGVVAAAGFSARTSPKFL
jgi:hypothetical protein